MCYVRKIKYIYNNHFNTASIPQSFTVSVIPQLFKKGNVHNVENFRGISIIKVITKLLTGILLGRLWNWLNVNKMLNEFQAGFNTDCSTMDYIF